MARTIRDANLETRTARLRLAIRRDPYFRSIEPGLALGYRRNKVGGVWIARRRDRDTGRYVEQSLGLADDASDADGATIFGYRDALALARAWWTQATRAAKGMVNAGPFTVADALDAYRADALRRGVKDLRGIDSAARAHIRPALGSIVVSELTAARLRRWHLDLASVGKRVRSKKGAQQAARRTLDKDDKESARRRRSTANRVLTVLKAALNFAFAEGHAASDDAWRRVLPFEAVDVARVRYLSADESVRLVRACDSDFRKIVHGALLTGLRWGELRRLRVADVDLTAGTVHVLEAKSGRPRHVHLSADGVALFASLCAGRAGSALVFTRHDGREWRASEQARPLAAACAQAKIAPGITFHGLRDSYASALAMKGVPMGVIAAQLGHSDTRMTEKHYAHLSPSYVASIVRDSLPSLGGQVAHDLIPLTRQANQRPPHQ